MIYLLLKDIVGLHVRVKILGFGEANKLILRQVNWCMKRVSSELTHSLQAHIHFKVSALKLFFRTEIKLVA